MVLSCRKLIVGKYVAAVLRPPLIYLSSTLVNNCLTVMYVNHLPHSLPHDRHRRLQSAQELNHKNGFNPPRTCPISISVVLRIHTPQTVSARHAMSSISSPVHIHPAHPVHPAAHICTTSSLRWKTTHVPDIQPISLLYNKHPSQAHRRNNRSPCRMQHL